MRSFPLVSKTVTFVSKTSGKDTKAIKEYIKNQLEQDKQADQLSIFDPKDPFTGSK